MEELIEVRRKAFEGYMRIAFPEDFAKKGASMLEWNGATYIFTWVHWYWQAWNAALDSVVVELPIPVKRAYHEYDLGYNESLDHCEEAIHAAGIKTKVKA